MTYSIVKDSSAGLGVNFKIVHLENNNQDQQNGYGSDINVPVYATVNGVSHKLVHREILSKFFSMDLQFWAI